MDSYLLVWLAHLIQPLLIALFVMSAAAKVQTFAAFRSTTYQLGVPGRWTGPAAAGVVLAESAVAVGVAVVPATPWPYALTGALAVLFALAGIRALGMRRTIACRCFGGSGRSLGWRQVALLPVWLGGTWLVLLRPLHWPVATGLAVLTASATAVAAYRAWRLRRLRAVLRADRLATAHSPG